jgi:hypothetical protein
MNLILSNITTIRTTFLFIGIVREWFDDNIFPRKMIRTPAKSFDINPIENVCDIQKVKVARDGIYADGRVMACDL